MNLKPLIEQALSIPELASQNERSPGGLPCSDAFLMQRVEPNEFDASVYEPVLCLILQGAKETSVGDESHCVEAGQCIVVSHDLPVLARITKASRSQPYLALVFRLDLRLLRSLAIEMAHQPVDPVAVSALAVAPLEAALQEVVSRYLALAQEPAAASVLAPLVRKELYFRLLLSKPGAMLRALVRRGSNEGNIARAIKTLRAHPERSWEVAELARTVGMSSSAFHKHFKAVTLTTPLQYQKSLRLTEARRMLLSGSQSVAGAAFAVGYESPSQFSREYTRRFGRPPRADLRVA